MLSNSALTYEWDDHPKDIEKAKSLFIAAKENDRIIHDDQGNPVQNWRQVVSKRYLRILEIQLNATSVKMQFICEDGDKWVIWDANNKNEVIEAAKKFKEYVSRGWLAYAVNPNTNDKGRRVMEFNPVAEEIVFAEGARIKLKDFAKKFKKVKVAAKTYPG